MGQNVITINGKHYDAKTGSLLESPHAAKHSAAKAPVGRSNGPSIDGFTRRPAKSVVAHAVHNKAEKSKTLMRGAVKKPVHHKVHAASSTRPKPAADKPLVMVNHDDKAKRAASVAKSKLISRFGNITTTPAPKTVASVAHVPVVPAPTNLHHHDIAPIPRPGVVNPFNSAIEKAQSHKQAAPKKTGKHHKIAKKLRISPRSVSFGSVVLAGILLSGFFVYQNIPNLAMRVAAARSGVHASLPDYKPAGFKLNGPIKYSTGQISIKYRSTTDERAYQVTQSASEWNSETLLENFVAVDRKAYQTYQDKGKTIYIYEGSNATWVDKGVWFQVEGASSLNSDQLLRIANSL